MGFPALRSPRAGAPAAPTGQTYFQSFAATLLQAPSTFPTTSLISYWKLDEASGTRVDSFGTNNLTDNNTTGSATGIISSGANFVTASSNYLSCTSNSTLQMSGNTDFTFSAWIKLTSNSDQIFIGKDDSAANSRDYTLDLSGGAARFYIQGGATYIATGGAASPGAWYFIVAWYDSSNGQLHLRVNDFSQADSATGATGTDVSAAQFRIGARQYSGFEGYANAIIDEVGLWKRVLTPTEITALYNGGAGMTYGAGVAATLSRLPNKSLTATFSPTGAIRRGVLKSLTATLSFVGAIAKRITDSGFTATLSFIGNLVTVKTFVRALTATLSFTGGLSRRTGKAFIATLTSTVVQVKRIVDSGFTATLSFVGAITKNISKALTATLSFIGNLATSLIHGGTVFTQSLTATLSFVGSMSIRQILTRAFAATLNFVGGITKSTRKNVTDTLSFVASLNRNLSKTFSAILSWIGNVATFFVPSGGVIVNLTGVAANPQIGSGVVRIEVITPPVSDLVAGGRRLYWLEDEVVYLTGVAASPVVGSGRVIKGVTPEVLEKLYPFPRPVVKRPLVRPVRATKKPVPAAVVVRLRGTKCVPAIGDGTVILLIDLLDDELMGLIEVLEMEEL